MTTDYAAVPNLTDGDTVSADNLDSWFGNFKAVFESGVAAGELVKLDATGKFFKSAGRLVAARQGGDASNWNTYGTTNYTPAAPKIQCGTARMVGEGSAIASMSITFPVAFSNEPIVMLTIMNGNMSLGNNQLYMGAITNTAFTAVYWETSNFYDTEHVDFFWLAIGE